MKFRGKWHASRGDRIERCSYCGARYLRSEMRRTMEGYLSCPLEGDGDSELELSEMNAEMATGLEGPIYREPGSGLGDDL